MNFTNLQNRPDLINKTLNLIEESFEYTTNNRFDIDFHPLFNKDNFSKCFIIEKENQVYAHIGVRTTYLSNGLKLNMYGGIATDYKQRGKGLYKKLFKYVKSQVPKADIDILWSDKIDLYKKEGFFPALSLYQYDQKDFSSDSYKIVKTTIEQSIQEIKSLYTESQETRPVRTEQDWTKLKAISSCEVYTIHKNSTLVNYFIKNKGQDLNGIIHEYGHCENLETLNLLRNYGHVWCSKEFQIDKKNLFGALIKVNINDSLEKYLQSINGLKILKLSDDFINFTYQDSQLELAIEDFFTGIWGPNKFEEFKNIDDIFIPGCDSI